MTTASFEKFTQRILDILKSDEAFTEGIAEFRLGDQGDNRDKEKNAKAYPLCYVTTATNPEVERSAATPTSLDTLPSQKITYEFWAVIVVNGATPKDTQKQLYSLTQKALGVLSQNIQLKKPGNMSDPICATSDIFTQRRHEKYRGELVEAMTIRVRPTVFASH